MADTKESSTAVAENNETKKDNTWSVDKFRESVESEIFIHKHAYYVKVWPSRPTPYIENGQRGEEPSKPYEREFTSDELVKGSRAIGDLYARLVSVGEYKSVHSSSDEHLPSEGFYKIEGKYLGENAGYIPPKNRKVFSKSQSHDRPVSRIKLKK